jgi:hypothetical protein
MIHPFVPSPHPEPYSPRGPMTMTLRSRRTLSCPLWPGFIPHPFPVPRWMFGVSCISSAFRFHPSPFPGSPLDVRRFLHFFRFQVSSLILRVLPVPRSPFPVECWTFDVRRSTFPAFLQLSGFIPHPSSLPLALPLPFPLPLKSGRSVPHYALPDAPW